VDVLTNAAITSPALQAWLDGIADDVQNSYSTSATRAWGHFAAPGTTLDTLTAYHYAANANAASDTAVHTFGAPVAGGGGVGSPSMVSICVSKLSNSTGRHNRGRAYLPGDGATYEAHQFAAAGVDAVVLGYQDLLDHINGSTIGGEDVTAIIASSVGPVVIARVRADSLPDTQRTRADGETSNHTKVAEL
jgi:hypothetical protein